MGKRGKLITLEGIDGSGKTTIAPMIASYLTERGYEVVVSKDPGGDEVSSLIRNIVLGYDMMPIARLFLYTAARLQLVHNVIQPAIISGKVVVCDRYIDSMYAYQGAGCGLANEVAQLTNSYPPAIYPDLTFLLDISLETAMDRLLARGVIEPSDVMDSQSQEYKRRVRDYYVNVTAKHSERVSLINAGGTIDDTWANVKAGLDRKFPVVNQQ